jgi:radical SAM protein with 4Fe4S-binding SPASM domain
MLALQLASRAVGGFLELTRAPFPPVVRIETTNHCNASCTFCPRDSIGRKKGFMEQDLFEDVIRQCAVRGARMVHLHGFGEPLLDKRLPERIEFARQEGIQRIKIFTNGALLYGTMAERLLASGLDEVKISLDGANATEFNELRVGLSHAHVVENTRKFRALRDERGLRLPKIVATCVVSSDKLQTERLLSGIVDVVDWAPLHNWAGARRLIGERKVRRPCSRLWRSLTVLVNGDVALCCQDHAGKEILGNCRQQTLAEIWNNKRYRELRYLHRTSRQDQISLCNGCMKCFY